jgi:hypothetical protein
MISPPKKRANDTISTLPHPRPSPANVQPTKPTVGVTPTTSWNNNSNQHLEARFATINLQLNEQQGRISQLEVNTSRIYVKIDRLLDHFEVDNPPHNKLQKTTIPHASDTVPGSSYNHSSSILGTNFSK